MIRVIDTELKGFYPCVVQSHPSSSSAYILKHDSMENLNLSFTPRFLITWMFVFNLKAMTHLQSNQMIKCSNTVRNINSQVLKVRL